TVRAGLADYVRATTASNMAPLSYQTSPLRQFSSLPFQAPPNLTQDRLWDIYEQYANLTDLMQRIDFLVKPTSSDDAYLVKYVPEEKRGELARTRILYEGGRDV